MVAGQIFVELEKQTSEKQEHTVIISLSCDNYNVRIPERHSIKLHMILNKQGNFFPLASSVNERGKKIIVLYGIRTVRSEGAFLCWSRFDHHRCFPQSLFATVVVKVVEESNDLLIRFYAIVAEKTILISKIFITAVYSDDKKG